MLSAATTLSQTRADKVTISGGEDNDSINNGNWDNYGYSNVTIDGGAGNDDIYNNWNFSIGKAFYDNDGSNVLFE